MINNDFSTIQDIANEFAYRPANVYDIEETLKSAKKVHIALYTREAYEGNALVVYETPDGKLWEVNGSHCSCYGLEGQWNPEETSWEALEIRKYYFDGKAEIQEIIKTQIENKTPKPESNEEIIGYVAKYPSKGKANFLSKGGNRLGATVYASEAKAKNAAKYYGKLEILPVYIKK